MEKHYDKYSVLGLNVAYYRKLRGFTQQQLAEKVFISKNHLSRIEAPKAAKSFSIDVIFEISDALEVDIAMLFVSRYE